MKTLNLPSNTWNLTKFCAPKKLCYLNVLWKSTVNRQSNPKFLCNSDSSQNSLWRYCYRELPGHIGSYSVSLLISCVPQTLWTDAGFDHEHFNTSKKKKILERPYTADSDMGYFNSLNGCSQRRTLLAQPHEYITVCERKINTQHRLSHYGHGWVKVMWPYLWSLKRK